MSLFIKIFTYGNKSAINIGKIKDSLALICQKYTFGQAGRAQ